MAWARIDDQFPDHPKVVEAGPTAGWLFVCGLAYAARFLTDGFIPANQVRRLADLDGTAELAETLVRVRLWERVEGGFQIHDYLDYNPSAEKVRATREARAEAGQRGGKASGQSRAAISNEANPEALASHVASRLLHTLYEANAKQNRTPYPAHPMPIPDPVLDPDPSSSTSTSALSLPWRERACAALGKTRLKSWEETALAAREAEGYTTVQLDWALRRAVENAKTTSGRVNYAMNAIVDAPEDCNGQDVQSGNGRHPAAASRKVRADGDVAAAWAKYATPVPVPDVPG